MAKRVMVDKVSLTLSSCSEKGCEDIGGSESSLVMYSCLSNSIGSPVGL